MIKYFAILKVKEIFQRWFENFLKSQSVTRLDFTSRKKVVRLLSERIICMQVVELKITFLQWKSVLLSRTPFPPPYMHMYHFYFLQQLYIYIYIRRC